MGTGFKGGADHYHSVSENLGKLQDKYDPDGDGLFGDRGRGGSATIRNIASDDPAQTAKDFYDTLAYGGIEKILTYPDGNPKGFQTIMSDGTIINYRPVSSSDGTPAVDIDVQYSDEHGNLVTQKIHFVKE